MKKQLIRLTEEDLSKIIESTVQRIITENAENEGLWDTVKSFAGQYKNRGNAMARQIGKNAGERMKQGFNATKNAAAQKYKAAKEFGNNVKQDVKNTWQGAQRDSSMKDMQRAFNNFKMAVEKFVNNGGQINPQLNSRISGIDKMLNSYQPNY